ncbi:hypothetical protein HPP92_018563, partial [Vanilla planifolia]
FAITAYQGRNLQFIPINFNKVSKLNNQDRKKQQVLKRMGSFGDLAFDSKSQLPKVDFSGLNQNKVHTPSWDVARNKVLRSLEDYGGFEVVYDKIGTEICMGLLGRAVPELFAQNEDTELGNPTQVPLHGAWMYKEGFPFLGIQLANLDSEAAMEEHVNTIWPQGNTYFRNTVWNYAVQMQEIILMIHRMILQGLGLEHLYEPHIESLTYSMRFSKYCEKMSNNKNEIVLPPHKDPNYLSIICQQNLDGLEVEASNGEWIHVSPLPNSFTVLLGESFMAWSNGRLKAQLTELKWMGRRRDIL